MKENPCKPYQNQINNIPKGSHIFKIILKRQPSATVNSTYNFYHSSVSRVQNPFCQNTCINTMTPFCPKSLPTLAHNYNERGTNGNKISPKCQNYSKIQITFNPKFTLTFENELGLSFKLYWKSIPEIIFVPAPLKHLSQKPPKTRNLN